MSKVAYLVLENGTIFKGKYFGCEGDVTGEIVFTTSMTGYLETLTDKSYYGQIIVQTFPLIGNYGVIPSDFESKTVGASAYIVKHWCQAPSNFRNEGDLDTFLKSQGIVGLYGIDTRTLTKMIRENGVMNGKITDSIDNIDMDEIKKYTIINAVESVSVNEQYTVATESKKLTVALMDFGLKENIKRELVERGCEVVVFPHNAKPEEVAKINPDGIMLTNGPGDPSENKEVIANLNKLLEYNIPTFGICLGHQLLALANGFETTKLKYGHRGTNQPVKDLETGRVYITSQNHGYAVVCDTVSDKIAEISFINVNDKTCEGINYKKHPVFSVQFHPEACGGAKDTRFLFDKFIDLMEVQEKCR